MGSAAEIDLRRTWKPPSHTHVYYTAAFPAASKHLSGLGRSGHLGAEAATRATCPFYCQSSPQSWSKPSPGPPSPPPRPPNPPFASAQRPCLWLLRFVRKCSWAPGAQGSPHSHSPGAPTARCA